MHRKFFVVLAVLSLACAGTVAIPALAKVKNPHAVSGLIDTLGHALHVESAQTPDEYRAAPLPASSPNVKSNASSVSPNAQSVQTQTLGPNLIQNPSLEQTSGGLPTAWKKGGYGTNNRTLTFPVTGHTGSNASQVSITSYTSGDAKWYPNNVSAMPGQLYQFSDYYESNAVTEVDVQLTMSDGSNRYIVLGKPAASASWQNFSAQFAAPAGSVSMTVFHVLPAAGSLTVDDYSLNTISSGGGGQNLLQNGDFETAGSGGLPADWQKGGYGTNTRTFSYPVAGASGNGAKISITSYSSGDAAWIYAPLKLPSGIYVYSDSYSANVQSVVEVQYHHSNGSYTYQDLASLPASSSFTSESVGFTVPSDVTDVLVYHLIEDVGSLTIDNASIEANTDTNGVFATGAVTLTFDNGWLSQYDTAMSKMDQYGFKGTFYIITHELSDYGYSGFVSKAQIKDMYADGQEIGSHTQTHPYLTDLSESQQWQEINGSRQDLFALNVGPIDSFAYPYGDYDSTTIALVQQAGYTNARSTINGNAVPNSDPYQLPRFVMLNTTTAAQAEAAIDEAIKEKAWIIIELHQVDNSGDTYATTPATFSAIVDYLHSKGVSVVTMQEGVQDLTD